MSDQSEVPRGGIIGRALARGLPVRTPDLIPDHERQAKYDVARRLLNEQLARLYRAKASKEKIEAVLNDKRTLSIFDDASILRVHATYR